ncbi:hypothetical protein [uncultured Paraglaciecola sp.]|uniref:hypothetical protein n=1 Tax=uncultured Paraglaciecola sp. TaxID=1765024 RepID=UPI0030DCA70F|tara:strand:+ start:146 stop:421 length:276 start_codon:yes stop_codon:yes gene_type:complete
MKPYKNIQSKHLGFLLLIARATAIIGLLVFIFSIVMFCLTFMGKSIGAMSLITFLPMSMGIIFFSGILAVLVAWEEGYRLRTEHMINSAKI